MTNLQKKAENRAKYSKQAIPSIDPIETLPTPPPIHVIETGPINKDNFEPEFHPSRCFAEHENGRVEYIDRQESEEEIAKREKQAENREYHRFGHRKPHENKRFR